MINLSCMWSQWLFLCHVYALVFKGTLLPAITIIICSKFQYCFYNASIISRVTKFLSCGKITQRLAIYLLQWQETCSLKCWEPHTSPIHKIFTLLESDIWNPRSCHSVILHNYVYRLHGFTPLVFRHSMPALLYQNGLKLNISRHCSTALTSRPPILPCIWLGDTQNLKAQES